MAQPFWYHNTEQFLLNHGKAPMAFLLFILIGISFYMLYVLVKEQKPMLPAAWLTYMFMP